MERDTKLGLGLLLGGAGALALAQTAAGARYKMALTVAGLGAAGAGFYYLFARPSSPARGGMAGGILGLAEDALLGGVPDETETPAPTITLPPPPGAPQLDHVIPFTGRLISPNPGGSVSRLPFRGFYEALVEITNNTDEPVVGALEVHTDETGTYGGTDSFVRNIEGIQLGPFATVHKALVLETSAGAFSNSSVVASVRFAGHHLFTTSFDVA